MKFISNLISNLKFIFLPHYWIMIDTYNEEWDKRLNALAQKHMFIPDVNPLDNFSFCLHGDRCYHASIGGAVVWVGNYPYAFFRYIGELQDSKVKRAATLLACNYRPSRKTIYKLVNKLYSDLEKFGYKHM